MHLRTILFVVSALLGVVIGYRTPYASEIAITLFLLSVIQLVVYLAGRKRDTVGVALSLFTFLIACGMVVGIVRVQFVEDKSPYVCDGACTFDAVVVSSPKTKDAYQTFIVRPVESSSNVYDVQVRSPLYPRLAIGESIRITGTIKMPGVIFPHAGEKSFDYASYLETRNVGSEMMFPTIESIADETQSLVSTLGRWKEKLVSSIHTYVASPSSSLASGMLFGNSSMSEELTQTFRVAGLSHIVVLSGFNIAIIIAFVLFVFSFLPLLARIALASVLVVLFVMMVGGEASVVRATGMAGLGLLAMVLGRPYVARQALIVSLFAIVMYEPQSLLHNVSLHLSFLATAGIVYLSDPIKRLISLFTMPVFIRELSVTSAAAYIATLPYLCYTFGTVSVFALLANILMLPLVPIAMLVTFLVVIASYVSSYAALAIGYADTLLINIIVFTAQTIEALPGSSLPLTITFSGMCALYAIIFCAGLYVSRLEKNETLQTDNTTYLTDTMRY